MSYSHAGVDRPEKMSYSQAGVDRLPLDRADSVVTKVCDLHVYKVPAELWRYGFNNVLNNVVTETVSVGIIRVPADLRLTDVRAEMTHQLAGQLLPADYVFLRSVGRSLTTLRGHQEQQLKVKHFVPPVAYAPEVFILEATPEVKEALAVRGTPSPGTSPSRHNLQEAGSQCHPDGSHTGRPHQSPGGDYRTGQRSHSDSPHRLTRDGRWRSSSGSSGDRRRIQPPDMDQRTISGQDTSSDEDDSVGSRQPPARRENKQRLEQTRLNQETDREELLKRARHIRQQTIKHRNEARDVWKKRYFEEKRRTTPLEDMSIRLENELDVLHNKQMSLLEGTHEKSFKLTDGPSEKNNYIIQCARLQHEIQEIQRRLDKTRTRLTAEMKLRVQAQTEMKVVRAEAMHNRSSVRAARLHPVGALGVVS